MKELKLKEEYRGLVISRACAGAGIIIFDTMYVDKSHYRNYSNIGFSELFEEVDVCEKCLGEKCICQSTKTIKYEGVPQTKKK